MAWPDDINVKDADGVTRAIATPNTNGRQSATDSRPIAVDEEAFAALQAAATPLGNVAHDAVDSGAPIKTGGKAYTSTPPAVSNGDRVDQAMTARGAAHMNLRRADGTEIDPDTPAGTYLTKSTPYFNSNAGNTKYLVATGAQTLTDYFIENPDASAKGYLQFFNAAAAADVTLGTTVPVRSIGLAGGEKANLSGIALGFSLGIVIAATTTSTGSTTATTGFVVNIGYKAG